MTELSAHVPKSQWEDGEFLLSRAVPDGEALPVLAAMPLTIPPSPAAIARLQHTFKLRSELDAAWAARPLRVVTDKGRLALLSEDPGGEPLLRLLGQPWVARAERRKSKCCETLPERRCWPVQPAWGHGRNPCRSNEQTLDDPGVGSRSGVSVLRIHDGPD